MSEEAASSAILEGFGLSPEACRLVRLSGGLINETWKVENEERDWILQRVNPIFDKRIHKNIEAVTCKLAEVGMTTPLLKPTLSGELYVDCGAAGCWRMMSFIEGVATATPESPIVAMRAGELVARFHNALEGINHEFVGVRMGVHDTRAHLKALNKALDRHALHNFLSKISILADKIFEREAKLPGLEGLPLHPSHGDLKFNNILFDTASGERAVCLVDLDTLGLLPLHHELGDAWRSWCGTEGEDDVRIKFDMDMFDAAVSGYCKICELPITAEEWEAQLFGVEWISLELCTRFAADALNESYFGWDGSRFASAAHHNELRARSMWNLHESAVGSRLQREAILKKHRPVRAR